MLSMDEPKDKAFLGVGYEVCLALYKMIFLDLSYATLQGEHRRFHGFGNQIARDV